MSGPVLSDQAARTAIAEDLDRTLVVEAAAGTGKTTELVTRVLRVLATGRAQVHDLVAVTFTEKAAGELKLRLRQELERGRHDEAIDAAARARLEHALTHLEDANISTIHGFCADILRERPVEASVDPLFVVLTEPQARRLYADAFAGWFQQALADMPDGVRRSLRRSTRPGFGADGNDDGPVDRLRAAGWDLVDWRDFTAPWTRPDFDRPAAIQATTEAVERLADLTAQPSSQRDVLYLDTAPARRARDELRLVCAAADLDAAEAVLVDLCRDRDFRRARRGSGATYGRGVARAEVYEAHQALLGRLDVFRTDADADLAARLREELRGSLERYDALKQQAGALDFLDLLLRTRDLVRHRDDVRADLQARFACLFVDEFQDTDPLQAEILLLLAADDPGERDWTRVRPQPGKLFIVGDPKQSIYRFRRADVDVYRRVCDQLVTHGALWVCLTTSFRSVPDIQRAVNAAFAPRMTGDTLTLQATYVPLAPHRPAIAGQPSVVALPVPRPYGRRQISGGAIDASLPDAVGAFVAWLVQESGWQVRERGGWTRIAPRHVCLLFRRFVNYRTDVTRAYVDALEARGLTHLLVGGRAFHGREEIETVRAALAAVEWPDDQLSVFATLRGALFAIGDEALLEYRQAHASAFHPFRVPDVVPSHLQPVADALRFLAELHTRRNRRPVAETIARLFERTRAHVGFALRRAGEQVLANVLHVAELARQYELSDGLSFRGFVEDLQAADGQATEAPIVEEGSDGVRLMTVHKAKGLEFPVVILADMTAKLAPAEASRCLEPERGLCAQRLAGCVPRDLMLQQSLEVAREREEGVRVAYVAATRASDLLVVPAVGDAPFDGGWVSPLNAAIYPDPDARRQGEPVPGSPPFRKDSVLLRPDDDIAGAQTVSPGLHRRTTGTGEPFEVAWWDPAALRLDVEPPFGLRRQELIARDVDAAVVAEGRRRYDDWRTRRAATVTAARVASIDVRTVTEWAAGSDGREEPGREAPPVEHVTLAAVSGRPAGARYGALVHASLAMVALAADAAAVRQVVQTQGRLLAATTDETTSAAEVVVAVLAHPLLAEAAAAATRHACWREMPVTAMQGDTLLEGVVDLAFATGDAVTVIDFKTDRAAGGHLAQYERQVRLYAEAIGRVTGKPARVVLMQI